VLNKVVKEGKPVPYYSHPHVEGENVIVSEGQLHRNIMSPVIAIDRWYSEIKNYNFSRNEFSYGTAQFSQLSKLSLKKLMPKSNTDVLDRVCFLIVWKETEKVGIAVSYHPGKNYTVIVARFKPPGNMEYSKAFEMNIFPPVSKSDKEVRNLTRKAI
jgi:hypothetical protein